MGKMPDGKVMYTLDGRPVTEEPEGSPEEKHYKRIINQVGPGAGVPGCQHRCKCALVWVLLCTPQGCASPRHAAAAASR